jgi:GNAT superfamily N-acetyltransferase
MPPKVRDAVAADAAEVRAVASSAWRDTYGDLLRPATVEAFVEAAYSVEMVERRIDRSTFLVAEDGDRIIAFANAIEGPDRLNLAAIYALPERRGEGAGTLLLTALRTRFPTLPIAADVLSGNRIGEAFYKRRGFAPREVLENQLFGESVVERRWWLGTPPLVGADER